MKQKILINKELNLEQLKNSIQKGGKFIAFQYVVGLGIFTQVKFSKAILIENNSEFERYKRKYDLISIFFGIWGIPWGPINIINCTDFNKKGGLDLTEDIMLNITKESIYCQEVEIIKSNKRFNKTDNHATNAITKIFKKKFENDQKLKRIIAATPITKSYKQPPYIIGLKVDDSDFESYAKLATEALYTRFMKSTVFEFINLNEENETNSFLQQQGQTIQFR